MTQNSEEVVVMAAALNQGTTMQGETDIEMHRLSRAPTAYLIWEPQSFQTREPTTFELMEMIGDLQRAVTDLAFGMSAPPSTMSHARNFTPEEPPLLGRIVIELSQPDAIPSMGSDMSTTTRLRTDVVTQTFDQAEASERGSSSQGENREKGRRTRNDPISSNPAPRRDQSQYPSALFQVHPAKIHKPRSINPEVAGSSMPSICLCPRLFKPLLKKAISNLLSLGLSLIVFHPVVMLPSTVRTINKLVIAPTIASIFATKYRICLTTGLSSHQAQQSLSSLGQ
ncbi:hypothetical protein HYC85_028726 [Camellia sinensis]|uniref:Uncharacterized protein n=1 Tax=Camellia sinensis TaxID=4442 RepID=A0A7J7FW19_CAMSI|nr:hypothetical protein HYC85_028726 [Camellia sinensis]